MPFRDHFRPPVSKRHSWEEVHGGWPMMIIQKLAPLLPEGYQAGPRVHLGVTSKSISPRSKTMMPPDLARIWQVMEA